MNPVQHPPFSFAYYLNIVRSMVHRYTPVLDCLNYSIQIYGARRHCWLTRTWNFQRGPGDPSGARSFQNRLSSADITIHYFGAKSVFPESIGFTCDSIIKMIRSIEAIHGAVSKLWIGFSSNRWFFTAHTVQSRSSAQVYGDCLNEKRRDGQMLVSGF